MILTSEREIATDRMIELAEHLLHSHDPAGELGIRPREMLDNVLSNIVQDITMLEHILTYKVPFILRSRSGATGKNSLVGREMSSGNGKAKEREGENDVPEGQVAAVQEGEGEVTRVKPKGKEVLPVRLLIVDSITALIRGADSSYAKSSSIGLTERSRHLCAVSDKLKALAVEFNLAVVVINQVSDVFTRTPPTNYNYNNGSSQPQVTASPMLSQFFSEGPEPPMLYATQSRHFSGQTEQLKKEASLGIVWANAVNTRIMLSRTGRRRMIDPKDLSKRLKRQRPVEDEEGEGQGVRRETGAGPVVDDTKPTLIRRAHVVFSSCAPPGTVDYVITTSGIHSIPDSYRLMDIAETLKRRDRMAKAILYGQDEPENNNSAWRSRTEKRPAPADGPGGGKKDTGGNGTSDGAMGGGVDGWEDEFGEEVFDDLGDLPIEFWEGRMDEVVVEPLALGGDV